VSLSVTTEPILLCMPYMLPDIANTKNSPDNALSRNTYALSNKPIIGLEGFLATGLSPVVNI